MKLTFLGTRGYIDRRTRKHGMHAALLVSRSGARVMVDCGEDWLTKVEQLCPSAIVITHSHPDHAWGLRRGSPCPVYASAAIWQGLKGFPIADRDRRVLPYRHSIQIGGIAFSAYPVEHSIRAPAVGYRIAADGRLVFYAPDLVSIPARSQALRNIQLYIGDGASIIRPIVRRRNHTFIGHAPIRAQLDWCAQARIPRAIFTHCGSGIVGGDEQVMARTVRTMGVERRVDACIAQDGMAVVLRRRTWGRTMIGPTTHS